MKSIAYYLGHEEPKVHTYVHMKNVSNLTKRLPKA